MVDWTDTRPTPALFTSMSMVSLPNLFTADWTREFTSDETLTSHLEPKTLTWLLFAFSISYYQIEDVDFANTNYLYYTTFGSNGSFGIKYQVSRVLKD